MSEKRWRKILLPTWSSRMWWKYDSVMHLEWYQWTYERKSWCKYGVCCLPNGTWSRANWKRGSSDFTLSMQNFLNFNFWILKCAARVGVDYGFVTQCINGGLGQQLQFGAEKATHEIAYPYPKFVPTIVYNRVSIKRFLYKIQMKRNRFLVYSTSTSNCKIVH